MRVSAIYEFCHCNFQNGEMVKCDKILNNVLLLREILRLDLQSANLIK